MGVATRSKAVETLRRLLDEPRRDAPYVLTEDLPDGFEPDPPQSWLWNTAPGPESPLLPPLRDPQAYALYERDEGAGGEHPPTPGESPEPLPWPAILHEPPYRAIHATAGRFTEAQQRYCRTSIDATMRGGVTSGVVYPAALCELARRFRFRNIGGASAGAIAAGLAAAAELGRTRWDRGGREPIPDLDDEQRRQGVVRQGFLGLADATAWFSQVDDEARYDYRLAQLFRPTERARLLYRLVVAAMRGRWSRFGALLLWSFGVPSRIVTAALLVTAPLLLVLPLAAGPVSAALLRYLLAVAWLAALTLTVVGTVSAVVTVVRGVTPPRKRPPALEEPVYQPPPRRLGAGHWLLGVAALGIGVVGGLWPLIGLTDTWTEFGGWSIVAVWFGLMCSLLVVCGLGVAKVVRGAKAGKFGLLSGSVGKGSFTLRGRGTVWDRVAGLEPSTFDDDLVPWLSHSMSRLAGLGEDEVLRFGHLWLDTAYAPPGSGRRRTPAELARLEEACGRASARVVNLELMTTELVHRVPYRWPLTADDQTKPVTGGNVPTLYFRRSDLEEPGSEMFPEDVLDALCAGGTPIPVARDIDTGDRVTDLYPLPLPWDLPVVFAIRMSMAFPGLFQAVPLYRLVAGPGERQPVRDDFGARIRRAGKDLHYPAAAADPWVEELWFSDGGITSNFPIHLFDAPLPLWPTVGINLGSHPEGHQHQDVWLPSDSQARSSPPEPQRGSMIGFLGAVFATSRGWADTSQTFMPGFRGRIAWVRQRSDEGGTNLFMERPTVAALALRGAVAGARLAKRFADEAHWQRHQWLRMRVAMGNLSGLRRQLFVALRSPTYRDLLARPPALTVPQIAAALFRSGGDPNPATEIPGSGDAPLDWFPVEGDYWEVAREVAAGYGAAVDDGVLAAGTPQPMPVIRQVPPV